ncbi:DUF6232 family protein [Gluconobacter oxydans]|uniref:DUF6232 family protein n=1 Tax=Gluconobacter oxydans TaxID=442 RepID=UPI00062CABF5|nr:DUF6232 family protein [Gluconobacter oxydans]
MKQKLFYKSASLSVSETTVKIGEMVLPLRQVAFMNVTQQPTTIYWIVFVASALVAIGTALSGYDNGQFHTTDNILLGIFVAVVIAGAALYFALKPKFYFTIKASSGHGYTLWSREYGELAAMKNGVESGLVGIYVTQDTPPTP